MDEYRRILESEYGDSPNNFHVTRRGHTLGVRLTYPNITKAGCTYIDVNQESVRASDGVRLHYDYERDGFVIEQASIFNWESDDPVCDPDWQEVAFIRSWAREAPERDED